MSAWESVREKKYGYFLDKHRDFTKRYDRGTPPHEDISDEEALDRYREAVAGRSEADFLASAQEAFSRMSPEERATFGVQLRDQRDLGFRAKQATAPIV